MVGTGLGLSDGWGWVPFQDGAVWSSEGGLMAGSLDRESVFVDQGVVVRFGRCPKRNAVSRCETARRQRRMRLAIDVGPPFRQW